MRALTTSDAKLFTRVKRCALITWCAAVALGLLCWVARLLDLPLVATAALVGVWAALAAFAACWVVLALSVLYLLFHNAFGRSRGA